MGFLICEKGDETGIREAVEYVSRRYGIPPSDIVAVNTYGRVGEPVQVTLTLFVHAEEPLPDPEGDQRPVETVTPNWRADNQDPEFHGTDR
jgi:hypothetical protein